MVSNIPEEIPKSHIAKSHLVNSVPSPGAILMGQGYRELAHVGALSAGVGPP